MLHFSEVQQTVTYHFGNYCCEVRVLFRHMDGSDTFLICTDSISVFASKWFWLTALIVTTPYSVFKIAFLSGI